ncbi:transmembrane protein 176 isoform 2-T2 [Spinachia spinachia]
MAVSVSRDLTVLVSEDVNAIKLSDRQQALRAAIRRGEPKSLGVSQIMLGLMVMSYSIPLHCTHMTEVVSFGVPWWTGLTFITAGAVAIVLDKHCTMKILWGCLIASGASMLLSVVAVIIYSVDMDRNPALLCDKTPENGYCSDEHYITALSRGLKSVLLLFTVAQSVISAVVCFLLLRQRRGFEQYACLNQDAPSTPTSVTPPHLN